MFCLNLPCVTFQEIFPNLQYVCNENIINNKLKITKNNAFIISCFLLSCLEKHTFILLIYDKTLILENLIFFKLMLKDQNILFMTFCLDFDLYDPKINKYESN